MTDWYQWVQVSVTGIVVPEMTLLAVAKSGPRRLGARASLSTMARW
jgi:hypothetical protein